MVVKAKLVEDKTRKKFKSIVELEGNSTRFFPTYPNVKVPAIVQKVTDIDILYTQLMIIGVILTSDYKEEMVKKVALKFYEELCQETFLCWDEVNNDGFYELIRIENESE